MAATFFSQVRHKRGITMAYHAASCQRQQGPRIGNIAIQYMGPVLWRHTIYRTNPYHQSAGKPPVFAHFLEANFQLQISENPWHRSFGMSAFFKKPWSCTKWFKQDVGPSSHLFKQLIVFNLSTYIISLGRSSSGHSSEEISRAAWREIWKVFMSMLTCFQGLTCFLDCVSVLYGVSQQISEKKTSHTFAFFYKSLQSTFEWLQMLPTKAKALVHEWKEKPPTSCVSRWSHQLFN